MGYQHLVNTLKAIAMTAPAARAFKLTVEFALGQGKDTATVGRLEDHFRDRPSMKACVERMKAEPAAPGRGGAFASSRDVADHPHAGTQ